MKPALLHRLNYGCKARFCGVLLAAMFSSVVLAEQNTAEISWQQALEISGVTEVLNQVNVLIDQEITNLGKAPLGFSAAQLEQLKQQFRQRFGSEQLKLEMVGQLEQSFSQQEIQQLHSILGSSQLQHLLELQQKLEDADVRKAMRSYRLRVKQLPPNSDRLTLLASLDEVLQQSTLESELKVELRKQLLAVVSRLKTKQSYSEELLDKQLVNYRDAVELEISENALFAYLYLLKSTPTDKLEQLLVSLDQPLFDRFMAICLQSVQHSFLEARQQINEDIRLAEH